MIELICLGDMKLPQLLEDEGQTDLPAIHHVYKDLRQKVYGIIFNHHHITFTRLPDNLIENTPAIFLFFIT